nr:DUF945 family protein [Chromobacterium sp. ASV5]
MSARKLLTGLGIIAVAGWGLIVPYMVGKQAEDELREQVEQLGQDAGLPFSVRLAKLERGWFFSEARVVYAPAFGKRGVALALDYRINQFAIPFSRWSETRIAPSLIDGAGNPAGLPIQADIVSVKGMDGETVTRASIPAFSWSDSHGLRLSIRQLNAALHRRQGQPLRYRFDAAGAQLQFAPAAGGAPLVAQFNQLAGEGVAHPAQQADQPWASRQHGQLASFHIQQGGKTLFQADGLTVDAEVRDQGDSVDIYYQNRLAGSQLSGPKPLRLSNLKFDFSYLNLNKAAFLALQKQLKTLQQRQAAGKATDPGADLEALLQAAGGLLRHSPSFHVDDFSFSLPQGSWHSRLSLSFDGKNLPPDAFKSLAALPALQSRASGELEARMDRKLLDALNQSQLADRARAADAALQGLVAQGLLKDNGKELSSTLTFNTKGMQVNGQPFVPGGKLPAIPGESPAPAPAIAPAPASADRPAAAAPTAPTAPVAAKPAAAPPSAKPAAAPSAPRKKSGDARHCLQLGSDPAIAACAEAYR